MSSWTCEGCSKTARDNTSVSIYPIVLGIVGAPHDLATNIRHSSRSFALLTASLSSKPVQSWMLSSHRFLCLPPTSVYLVLNVHLLYFGLLRCYGCALAVMLRLSLPYTMLGWDSIYSQTMVAGRFFMSLSAALSVQSMAGWSNLP